MLNIALIAAATLICGTQARESYEPNVLKWGPSGHSTVAAIAMSLLKSNATSAAAKILPDVNGDLTQIASWADSVRSQPQYAWSGNLHFINSPDWACNYNRQRDCHDDDGTPNVCVDMAIQNYTSRLSDVSLSIDERAEAFKFLVHFSGDISQPLHVGFTTDEGGNTQKGSFMNSSSQSLHAVWDVSIIEKRISDDFNGNLLSFQKSLITRVASGDYHTQIETWQICNSSAPFEACSLDWANESVKLACSYAYVETDGVTHIEDGFVLKDDYYLRNLPIIERQLARAGVRLANVLNHLFPTHADDSNIITQF